MTTTADLAALAREVGGDKVTADSIAKGYQDPHFVEAKAQLPAEAPQGRPAGGGRPATRNRLAAAADTQSRQCARSRWAAAATWTCRNSARSWRFPTGQVTRAMGDVHPLGNPHYWLDPENGRRIAKAFADQFSQMQPRQRRLLPAALRRFRQAPDRSREGLGGQDGALQGPQSDHLSPLLAELLRAFRIWTWSDYVEPKPGIPPTPEPHARADQH